MPGAAGPRLLLAGSTGPERVPVRPDPTLPDWHEPLHVRDPRSARERLSAQVEAGADVIVAPTWLTHRRALLPVGETRQARAWTVAAVRVAREAVEWGLERRVVARTSPEPAGDEHGDGEHDGEGDIILALARSRPLVAAVLPALDAAVDSGTGRLLPQEAASERDYHDQAGLLADAEPDLLLVEGQSTPFALRLAVGAARETGLPTWAALSGVSGRPAALDPMLAALQEAALPMSLVPAVTWSGDGQDPPESLLGSGVSWGGLFVGLTGGADETAGRWLEAGARVMALLDGATPAALEPLRSAIDAHEQLALRDRQQADERWWRIVGQAARMAPGGRALWLAETPDQADPAAQLPAGFEWLVLHPGDAQRLPEERFRLVVDRSASGDAVGRAARLLEPGGMAAIRLAMTGREHPEIRVILLDEAARPPLAILRRED